MRMAVVVPHGGELIPTLYPERDVSASLKALAQLKEEIARSGARTLVVATPHGIRIRGAVSLGLSTRAVGTLEGEQGTSERLDLPVARDLGERLLLELERRDVPAQAFSMGASSGPASIVPLDWGAFIPLWHLTPEGASVLVLSPARELGFRRLAEVGRALAAVAGEDVVFVASSDLSHSHREDGPYGYDPAAKVMDERIAENLPKPDLLPFLESLDPAEIERAKPDGLWQMAILAGAQSVLGWRGEVLSYDRPTYFGMLCARFA